jgi:hypothetical protein
MATTIHHQQANVRAGDEGLTHAIPGDGGQPEASRLTTQQVWHQLAKASFAVLSHVTPAGEPRSSGVMYKTLGRQLYVAVAPDGWKASACLIEVIPEGTFVTYGVGVPLLKMRDPATARARVPVSQKEDAG